MSCKSAIYTVNADVAVAEGGTIPLGSIVRRYGSCIDLNGNGVTLSESGSYHVAVSVTAEPTTAGPISIDLLQDGNPVPGAVASGVAAAAGDPVPLAFTALVRLACRCSGSNLTVRLLEGGSNIANVALVAERI